MSSKFTAKVVYESGLTTDVVIGQRELAAVEAQPFARLGNPGQFLTLRYAAYDALRRANQLPRDGKGQAVAFDAWDDLVDEVTDPDEDTAESPDPTQPVPPAEN